MGGRDTLFTEPFQESLKQHQTVMLPLKRKQRHSKEEKPGLGILRSTLGWHILSPQFKSLRQLAASPTAGMRLLTLVADVPAAGASLLQQRSIPLDLGAYRPRAKSSLFLRAI